MIKRIATAAALTVVALGATTVPAQADTSTRAFHVQHQSATQQSLLGGVCLDLRRHRRVYDLPFGGQIVSRWSRWNLISVHPC